MSRLDSPLRGKVIFNLGARRSGTYWLQRIVASHPEVCAVPSETYLFSHGIALLFQRFQHSDRHAPDVGQMYVDRDVLLDATRDLCDTLFGEYLEPGSSRVAERTPWHVLHLELITAIYPDARYVHIIRDGRDVARSIKAQSWGSDTIAGAAEEWRDSVTAGRHAGLGTDRYREIRYEDLLEQPGRLVHDLFEWLDLEIDAGIVDRALAEADRQANVDRSYPKLGSGKWQDDFSHADLDAFMRVAGDLLIELGYESVRSDEQRDRRPNAGPLRTPARRVIRSLRTRFR
jgi:sulfotransferase family protein